MQAIHTNYKGRLGNQILIYLMSQYLAEKYNLIFDTSISDKLQLDSVFNVKKISGSNFYNTCINIDDSSIVKILKQEKITSNLKIDGFFQNPEVLNNETIQNKYKEYLRPIEESKINDLFVHVRLGDVTNRFSLPYEYYDNTISKLNFDSGVISTDSPDHEIIEKIRKKYNLKILLDSPLNSIMFGIRSKNIVLSSGSFSFLIGFYSKNSNKFCIDNEKMKNLFGIDSWCGDMFSIFNNKPGWFLYS